jgi:Nif-specific regulatory protein
MIAQAINIHHLVEAERQRLRDENQHLREELRERYDFANIIGNSSRMRQVYEQITQVASTNTTVLIRGESGTGKELIAHAVHYNSPRAKRPFIRVSCAALPETLIESEMFGHEKGAFTGAQAMKKGRFELADGGTLFLDEIGDLSPTLQIKLLRVLQEREFERLGGTSTIKVNVRLLAATNRDLEGPLRQGPFVRISITASMSFRFSCRRYASAAMISSCWASISSISTPASTASPSNVLRPQQLTCSRAITGPVMCVS